MPDGSAAGPSWSLDCPPTSASDRGGQGRAECGARYQRLRSTIALHVCTGYEVAFRCLKTENAHAEIVRWNGPRGDFTSLRKLSGPNYGVQDGDLVEATIDSNVLRGFINGVEVISATDDVYDSGTQGSGSTSSSATPNADHGSSVFFEGVASPRCVSSPALNGVQDGDLVEATIDSNVLWLHQWGGGHHRRRLRLRHQGITSSSATLTPITGSRFSRSTPTTTECSR